MEQIKFRAWDGSKMLYDVIYVNDNAVIEQMQGFPPIATVLYRHDIVSVMLFSGFVDKSGKEIYKGDVVTFGRSQKYCVAFDNGCFYLYHWQGAVDVDGSPYRWGPMFRVKEVNFEMQVIGNIYENPELSTP